ncbi:MAG: hypothetical protein ACOX3R_04165 [Desulfitobacteriia bacterium]
MGSGITDPEDFQGTVVVSIIGGGAAGTPIDGVKIYAYDDRGVIIKEKSVEIVAYKLLEPDED